MSAAVLALPTVAPALVAQRRRRGPLPKTVCDLSAYRAERNKTPEERDAENVARVKRHFLKSLDRVMRGELTGVVIVESSIEEGQRICVAGDVCDDLDYLQRILGHSVAEVRRWQEEKRP